MTLRSLTVVATARCNLACEYCYLPSPRKTDHGWQPLRRALAILVQRASGDLDINLTGGEPLLAFRRIREVVDCVTRAVPASTTLHWRIFTNGLLLDETALAFFETHDFRVRLSCDGSPGSQALRGRATFARLDRVLDELCARHPRLFDDRLEISMVLAPDAIGHFAESVQYLLGKGLRAIAVTPAMGARGWNDDRYEELRQQFERVFDVSMRHYDRTREVPLLMFRKTRRSYEAPPDTAMCGAPDTSHLALDVDGVAYGCLLASATYQGTGGVAFAAAGALRVGRPGDDSFDENLRRLPEVARATGAFDRSERRHSSYRRCIDCEYGRRCRVCPLASAHEEHGTDPDRVPDFLCAFMQCSLACDDRFPCQADAYDLLSGRVPFPELDLRPASSVPVRP